MFDPVLPLSTWERFVKDGTLDSGRIRKEITESWYRCKEAQVSPFLKEANHILKRDQFLLQKEKHSLLFEMTSPHIKRINDSINSLGMMALVIDSEGYVLSISGNEEVLKRADQINFVEGVRWTEGEVGTNAIGTALQIEEPVMVIGSEHYSVASHQWSCSASPIRNDDGKLLGVINVSCPIDRVHPYMLGTVTTIAYAIERELSIRVHKDEMELIQKSIELIDSNKSVVICNNKQEIIFSSKPIRDHFPKLNGKKLNQLAEYGLRLQWKVPIYSEFNKNQIIGRAVYLEKQIVNKTNHLFIPITKSNKFDFKGEIGTSRSFRNTLEEMKLVAKLNTNVYIHGETGTGKELIAQSIHENSSRKNGPFIAINCGAIPKELIGSELFGYVDGAFTGARRHGYKGKFEQANGGTIFLDEIAETPESMQVYLLRVLEERKVTPIGGTKEIPLDIRIITATHRDLHQLVSEGKLREDLYYRLHVFPILVPPLRERKEDIPLLIRYVCQENNWCIDLPQEVLTKLITYEWPGNIRELVNVMERISILSQEKVLTIERFLTHFDSFNENALINKGLSDGKEKSRQSIDLGDNELSIREKIQRDIIVETFYKTQGNVMSAAKILGVPRSTFYKRLKKFNL